MVSEVRFFWDTPIDVLSIKKAWEMAFNKRVSDQSWEALWQWRFTHNPLADRIDAAYICEGNIVVSFVAFSPLQVITCNNERYKAALGNIGFTNPDYHGRGYYSLMYKALMGKLAGDGYQVLLGFDNHNSHYPEVKHLQWKDIGVLNNFSICLQNGTSFRGSRNDCKVQIQPIDENVLQNISYLWRGYDKTHVERSFSYLKWRLLDNPRNKYNAMIVDGNHNNLYIIYKQFSETEIDIMEMKISDTDYDYSELLKCGMEEFSRLGFHKVNIWSNLYSDEHLIMEKLGFQETGFSTYFVYRNLSDCSGLSSLRKWHIRFLDSDVY